MRLFTEYNIKMEVYYLLRSRTKEQAIIEADFRMRKACNLLTSPDPELREIMELNSEYWRQVGIYLSNMNNGQ